MKDKQPQSYGDRFANVKARINAPEPGNPVEEPPELVEIKPGSKPKRSNTQVALPTVIAILFGGAILTGGLVAVFFYASKPVVVEEKSDLNVSAPVATVEPLNEEPPIPEIEEAPKPAEPVVEAPTPEPDPIPILVPTKLVEVSDGIDCRLLYYSYLDQAAGIEKDGKLELKSAGEIEAEIQMLPRGGSFSLRVPGVSSQSQPDFFAAVVVDKDGNVLERPSLRNFEIRSVQGITSTSYYVDAYFPLETVIEPPFEVHLVDRVRKTKSVFQVVFDWNPGATP